MIEARHVNQFLTNCVQNKWAGVFFSGPHESNFHFIIHDLTSIQHPSNNFFLFYPFDVSETPIIKLRADYVDDGALKLVDGLNINANFSWTNPRLNDFDATTFDEYSKQFTSYLNSISQGNCNKAILSTIVRKNVDGVNLGEFIFRLRSEYPQSYIYILSSPLAGTWIGATPETFIDWTNSSISTMSLAGTMRTSAKSSFGDKEFDEQKIVTDYIAGLFETEFGNVNLHQPSLLNYGNITHLLTRLESKLTQPFNVDDLLDFAIRYHPTPAVGGFPKSEALKLIHQTEIHPRLYYSGFMGMVHQDQAQLMVNLRCMAVNPESLFIFAGGGITSRSVLESEWQETRLKAEALLKYLDQA